SLPQHRLASKVSWVGTKKSPIWFQCLLCCNNATKAILNYFVVQKQILAILTFCMQLFQRKY
ncbi:uncharacterized protein METZ01_LOCUS86751, partial [marine metagenome]